MGFVTGHTQYVSERDGEKLLPIGIYSRIEKLTKKLESEIGSCVGADGAIFAIRKELYQPLNDFDINDLVIPLEIIKQGFRGIIEEYAFCFEKAAEGITEEYRRQVRITSRTIKSVFQKANMLNPLKYGFFSFELFSHKLLRFLVPYLLIALFASNVILLHSGIFYRVTFVGQILFYCLALFRCIGRHRNGVLRSISFAETFVVANFGILMGWVSFIRGESFVTWTKTR
jgi:cellulose synthase/poly-beta-1,6-N-acetylglucosamine synthase-like glycosyltransferase